MSDQKENIISKKSAGNRKNGNLIY